MQQSGNLCQALGSAQQCQHDWEHLLELHGEPLQTPFQLRVSVLLGGPGCSGGAGLHGIGRAISTEVL